MTIYRGSRYQFENLDRVVDGNGNQYLAIFPRSLSAKYNNTSWSFRQYVVIEGDRMETLAYRAYGHPEMWWLIADANPEIFHPEDNLAAGMVLRIPDYRPLRRVALPAGGLVGGPSFSTGGFSGATLR